MKNSPSARKSNRKTRTMMSNSEVDAAIQLIQLSGDSDFSKEEFAGNATKSVEQQREESIGDSNEISSTFIRDLKVGGFPYNKRKKRYRSIDDIYSVTEPVIMKKRGKKFRN